MAYDPTRDQQQQDQLLNYSKQRINDYKVKDNTLGYVAGGSAFFTFLIVGLAIKLTKNGHTR